jgi:hypothetical protein
MKSYVLLLLILYVIPILKQIAYTVTCKHPTIQMSTIKDVFTNFGQFCKWPKRKVKHVQVLEFFILALLVITL